MKDRIYIPVFGLGFGHATRMAIVAQRLIDEGFEVYFSSFGEGLEFLKANNYRCYEVPEIEIGWDLYGRVSVAQSLRNTPLLLRTFVQQVKMEIQIQRELEPSLILSDSRLSAIVASKIRGINSITILNQLRVLLPPEAETNSVSFLEDIGGELLGEAWSLSDVIMIPDLPPPYTISEANLWGIYLAEKKKKYAGFMVQKSRVTEKSLTEVSRTLKLESNKPLIFVQFGGPSRVRNSLIQKTMKTASENSSKYEFVISASEPYGSSIPKMIEGGWLYEWCPVRDELLQLSNVVVSRAGHTTISQAINAGKPMITIPISRHGEQLGNAKKLEALGMGIKLDQDTATPKKLVETINLLMNDGSYLKNAMNLRKVSEKHNGIETTLDEVFKRLS